MTHEELILRHFRTHKYLSSMQAFSEYGITRLASRIHDLRAAGFNIGSIWRMKPNRYGKDVNYLDYFLISAPHFQKKDLKCK